MSDALTTTQSSSRGNALKDYSASGFARAAHYFDGLVEQFGHDHRALDYGSRSSQRLRFDVLTTGLALDGRSVLDVGCGFGDFADYLDGRGINVSYRGIDVSSRMIEQAKLNAPKRDVAVADILADDFQASCDIAVANGIFYMLGPDAETLMHAMVSRMFELAREAVAFTSLSTRAPQATSGEYHADPVATLRFCQSLTPFVCLRHDYLAHDFAVFLYRNAPGA